MLKYVLFTRYRVSARLGVPPVVIHSTMSLSNWRRIDNNLPINIDNLATIHSFDETRDLQVCSMFNLPSPFRTTAQPLIIEVMLGRLINYVERIFIG